MSCPKQSAFSAAPDILPLTIPGRITAADLVDAIGSTCFEARQLARGARLFRSMIEDGATLWLGIAGAGIAGGLGGLVTTLVERGFVDVICTTGAQAYHDLHFAFGLPVKAVSPEGDDDDLRRRGDTRIYDIGIREEETLEAQDALLRRFVEERYESLRASAGTRPGGLSSPEFTRLLGLWAAESAPHPDRSFVVAAARAGVPVFWDSFTNHSIGLNLARLALEGREVSFSLAADIEQSAAVAFGAAETGFVELGGGGPKNFIQQTGPYVSQILGIKDFHGASRGLQIGTANVREGSLSSCTFGEAVTWGKYVEADEGKLVQLWGEYSILFPLLVAYVMDRCSERSHKRLQDRLPELVQSLRAAVPPSE
ncbi:MAG: deoxyhypusine synthase family protein [Polyangia bacterium]|jgi:deoxyhypusine synthase|nr:deoxyhypusine synthase family protein [Polyangia bacterium]